MKDLRKYGKEELSNHIMNTEHLYFARPFDDNEGEVRRFRQLLKSEFYFTSEQWDIALTDISEYNAEVL